MKEFKFKIEGAKWEEAIDKAFTRANAKTTIDGFRKGKAPKDAFIKKFGKESLLMDAADIVMNESYVKTLKDNADLEIVAEPQVNLGKVDLESFEFTITLVTMPELKLGKYKGLKVKKEAIKVTKEEIEEEIHSLQHRYEESVVKEGPAAFHDVVTIDFEGFKDGVAFDGGKGNDYNLQLGSQTFIPGFEEQIVGMKKGETKDISVSFPENYHSEELKGKPVVFKVTLKEVQEQLHPELNADFFADLNMEGITDLKSLEKQLEENIKTRKEVEVENKYIDDLLAEAAKNVKVDLPEAMIHTEIHRMMHQYEDNLKMQGLTLEQFYQYTNSNEEALEAQMHDEAKNRVLYRLMLDAIAKEENIEVTDAEVEAEAVAMSSKYNMEKDKFLEMFGGLETLKYDLKMRQAIDILKS